MPFLLAEGLDLFTAIRTKRDQAEQDGIACQPGRRHRDRSNRNANTEQQEADKMLTVLRETLNEAELTRLWRRGAFGAKSTRSPRPSESRKIYRVWG